MKADSGPSAMDIGFAARDKAIDEQNVALGTMRMAGRAMRDAKSMLTQAKRRGDERGYLEALQIYHSAANQGGNPGITSYDENRDNARSYVDKWHQTGNRFFGENPAGSDNPNGKWVQTGGGKAGQSQFPNDADTVGKPGAASQGTAPAGAGDLAAEVMQKNVSRSGIPSLAEQRQSFLDVLDNEWASKGEYSPEFEARAHSRAGELGLTAEQAQSAIDGFRGKDLSPSAAADIAQKEGFQSKRALDSAFSQIDSTGSASSFFSDADKADILKKVEQKKELRAKQEQIDNAKEGSLEDFKNRFGAQYQKEKADIKQQGQDSLEGIRQNALYSKQLEENYKGYQDVLDKGYADKAETRRKVSLAQDEMRKVRTRGTEREYANDESITNNYGITSILNDGSLFGKAPIPFSNPDLSGENWDNRPDYLPSGEALAAMNDDEIKKFARDQAEGNLKRWDKFNSELGGASVEGKDWKTNAFEPLKREALGIGISMADTGRAGFDGKPFFSKSSRIPKGHSQVATFAPSPTSEELNSSMQEEFAAQRKLAQSKILDAAAKSGAPIWRDKDLMSDKDFYQKIISDSRFKGRIPDEILKERGTKTPIDHASALNALFNKL